MNKSKSALISLASLLMVLVLVVVNLPIRLLFAEPLESFSYTDLEGATFFKGDLWVDFEDVPGLTHLVYSWCPSFALLSWCVDLEHSAFTLNGQVSVSPSQSISVSGMDIESLDINALGLASGLVDARLRGRIESMELSLSNCPMKSIEYLEGQLSTADIQVFGLSAGAHQIGFNSSDSQIDAQLSGDTFLGRIQLLNGKYSAKGEMTAPESMAGMAQSFMTPLGNNRFGWQIQGDLPC